MKKILSLVYIVLSVALGARADYLIPDRPHYGHEPRPHNGGYLVPGPSGADLTPNPYPQPLPPQIHPLPPQPQWDNLYGPPRTVRWENMGGFRVEKLVDTRVSVSARQQFVNEIYIVVEKNNVNVKSAWAYMANGQPVEIRGLVGNLRQGQFRIPLDYRNSLRIDRIEIVAESGLIGSRANMNIQLGLAF